MYLPTRPVCVSFASISHNGFHRIIWGINSVQTSCLSPKHVTSASKHAPWSVPQLLLSSSFVWKTRVPIECGANSNQSDGVPNSYTCALWPSWLQQKFAQLLIVSVYVGPCMDPCKRIHYWFVLDPACKQVFWGPILVRFAPAWIRASGCADLLDPFPPLLPYHTLHHKLVSVPAHVCSCHWKVSGAHNADAQEVLVRNHAIIKLYTSRHASIRKCKISTPTRMYKQKQKTYTYLLS